MGRRWCALTLPTMNNTSATSAMSTWASRYARRNGTSDMGLALFSAQGTTDAIQLFRIELFRAHQALHQQRRRAIEHIADQVLQALDLVILFRSHRLVEM